MKQAKANDKLFVNDILEAIKIIESFVANKEIKDFLSDILLQDGVIRRLEIIGEASNNLSDDFKANHPAIPWPSITGLRNMVIHKYFRVDLAEVWNTIQHDLPELKQALS